MDELIGQDVIVKPKFRRMSEECYGAVEFPKATIVGRMDWYGTCCELTRPGVQYLLHNPKWNGHGGGAIFLPQAENTEGAPVEDSFGHFWLNRDGFDLVE